MADITINAELRTDRGSATTGRLRASGRVPGVVYGKGTEAISISLDHREFRNTFAKPESRTKDISLVIDGAPKNVKIQSIQRDPVRGTAAHVDFIVL